MGEQRSVVITGASRGLGLATAAHLYRQGWTVVGAMRSPEAGLAQLRTRTGAGEDDPRLIGVRLDLDDPGSVAEAAEAVRDAVGAPYGLVHNAGIAGVGCVEEMTPEVWQGIVSTNLLGPARLTHELLPAMRAAGRGRIVAVSSAAGVRGMPAISAYSAAKGALERWAESLSQEISPFGLGVTVLVAGSFKTDILEQTPSYAEPDGPYTELHTALERFGGPVQRFAAPPERFAQAVGRALDEQKPFTRHAVGPDAKMMVLGSRLLPTQTFFRVLGRALRLPGPGSMRD